jgi:hypothetical protein
VRSGTGKKRDSMHINIYSFHINKEQRTNPVKMNVRCNKNILEEKKWGGGVSLCLQSIQEKGKERMR